MPHELKIPDYVIERIMAKRDGFMSSTGSTLRRPPSSS